MTNAKLLGFGVFFVCHWFATSVRSQTPEVILPIGHGAKITGLEVISPRLLASCSEDSTLIVWDIDTGFPLHRIFLPDVGNHMAIDSRSGNLFIHCGNQRRGFRNVAVDPASAKIVSESIVESPPPALPVSSALPLYLKHQTALLGKPTVYKEHQGRALVGFEDGTVQVYSTAGAKSELLQQFTPLLSRTTSVAAYGDRVATWRYNASTAGREETHDLTFWRPGRVEVVSAAPGKSTSIFSGVFVDDGKFFVTCENRAFDSTWWLVTRETVSGKIVGYKESRSPFPTVLSISTDKTSLLETFFSGTGPGAALWRVEKGVLTFVRDFPLIKGNQAVLDSRRQRIYSQSFVAEGHPAVNAYHADSGVTAAGFRSPGTDEMFGTVVDSKLDPDSDSLILSTYHRGIGYCGVLNLANHSLREIPHDGIHSAFAVGNGRRQLLLASTEGSVAIAIFDLAKNAVTDRWTDPQSESHREHRVAAVGWEYEKDSVAYSPIGSTVYVVKPTGAVQALQVGENGAFVPLGELLPLNGGEWCILLPEGHYAASPNGAGKLAFTEGVYTFPFEKFDLLFNQPARIAESFGGLADTAKPFTKATEERRRKHGLGPNGADISAAVFTPGVSIVNREENYALAEQATASVSLSLGGAGEIDTRAVSVTRNGVKLPESSFAMDGDSAAVVAPLVPGNNLIEISKSSSKPWESPPVSIRIQRESGVAEPRLFLLGIGVSDYVDDRLDLTYASKDILDVIEFFRSQEGAVYKEVKTLALLEGDATKEKIRSAREFFAEATVDDTAFVFVAGHGMLEAGSLSYFFGTTDIEVDDVSKNGMPYEELTGLLESSSAGSRVMLMDTCFAGEVEMFDVAGVERDGEVVADGVTARSFALTAAPRRREGSLFHLRNSLFSNLGRSTGLNVITASGGMEFVFAGETSDVGNGLFTHCLLEGLSTGRADRDGDGIVHLSEAFSDLGKALFDLSGGGQKAFLRESNAHGDIPLAKCKELPRFDEGKFLGDLIKFSEGRGLEEQYAAMFAPSANYFGSEKTPEQILFSERAYHEKFDGRTIHFKGEPVVERLSDTAFRVSYRLHLYLINRQEARTHSSLFGAKEVIEQDLEIRVIHTDGIWKIQEIKALRSGRISNPHFRVEG